MSTQRLNFRRADTHGVQSVLPALTERERVIAHLMERYAISQQEASDRYTTWDVINNVRFNLGIK